MQEESFSAAESSTVAGISLPCRNGDHHDQTTPDENVNIDDDQNDSAAFPSSIGAVWSRTTMANSENGGIIHRLPAAIPEDDGMDSTLGEPLVMATTNHNYHDDSRHGRITHDAMRDIPRHNWRHDFCDCCYLIDTPTCAVTHPNLHSTTLRN